MNRPDQKRNYNNNYNQDQGQFRVVDTAEKRKLVEQAQANKTKISQPKNVIQKVKLILNVIAPDNAEKKFGELRNYLFGDLKTKDECFAEEIEYDESIHKLSEGLINVEILEIIVKNVFRKAIREKEYCIFYGELCEKMMKQEL